MKIKKMLAITAALVLGCFALTACGGSGGESEEKPADTSTEAYSVQLTSGNYTVGIDIPIGTYNVTVIKGKGYVYSTSYDEGSINANMGIDDGSGTYEDSFQNLILKEDQRLTIEGPLTIEITSEKAQTKNITPRETKGKECTLEGGNFTAGEDFEPGVYDIKAVSGNGNVYSDNMSEGGINSTMGTDMAWGIYEPEFKNVDLPEGTVLTISGVTVQLTPSASESASE